MIDTIVNICLGLLLLYVGFNIGILVAYHQGNRALELLQEAKRWHKKIEDDLRRLQEQTRK